MKKRFTEAQIIGFLREAEAGLPAKPRTLASGACHGPRVPEVARSRRDGAFLPSQGVAGPLLVVKAEPAAPRFGGAIAASSKTPCPRLMDVHPHECATYRHSLPPLCVALRLTVIGDA